MLTSFSARLARRCWWHTPLERVASAMSTPVAPAEAAVPADATPRATAESASSSADGAIPSGGAIPSDGAIAGGTSRSAAVDTRATITATQAIVSSTTPAISTPTVTCLVEAAIPSEPTRAQRPKVWVSTPAPNPGCCQPHPAVRWVVCVGIGAGVPGHALVACIAPIGHPNPSHTPRCPPTDRRPLSGPGLGSAASLPELGLGFGSVVVVAVVAVPEAPDLARQS